MSTMSSIKRPQSTKLVTYSRKKPRTTIPDAPVKQLDVRTARKADETSTSFWDFELSSDEEELGRKVPVRGVIAVTSTETSLKRKAVDGTEGRGSKKQNGRSRSSTPVETTRKQNVSVVGKQGQSSIPLTPRKSNLVARSTLKAAVSAAPAAKSRQRTPQPSTLPHPTTPKSKASPTSATPSPKQSHTPTKRPFSRVHSSPASTPASSSSRNSNSQPPIPTTPRTPSNLRTRSRTFNDFFSPKMTPKQEKTWDFLPLKDDGTSPSPRRRLVDKLREQVIRSPERVHTPPTISIPEAPSLSTFEDEISRVLAYQPPQLLDEPRSQRKELSQSESQGTYLSRSRSFLAEPNLQDSLSLTDFDSLFAPEPPAKEHEEEEDLSAVKSWHELKRGGEDKRLLDEMEDLIEEAKSGKRMGLRRSIVLQIAEKLLNDVQWRRKFKALGLMSSFIQNVTDANTDPILLVTTLLAIDLIPKPVPSTVSKEVLRLCLAGLRDDRDLATLAGLRSIGASKILKSELLSLHTQMAKSQIVPVALTARNLAHGILVDLSVGDIRPICEFLGDFEYEGQWKTLAAIAGSLEKSTHGRVVTGLKDQHVQVFGPILQQGISQFESDVVLRKATLSFLRVCINLTNSSNEICEALNTDISLATILANVITADAKRYTDADYRPDTTSHDDGSSINEEDHEKRESRFEILLLSLGLMINFVQESDQVKDMILTSPLANNIKRVFEKLIALDEHANHAFGYLALLLAHLIIPSRSGRSVVVKQDTRKWVERLLDDFVGIHRVVQSQSQEEVERKEVEGMAGEVEKVLLLLRSQ